MVPGLICIRKLFRELADPGQLEPLNLPEVLDWACSVLNRVDRSSFFASFDEGAAVQYFYEPFLEAFDPELRKELGVWYTPREVVQYMVERVDRVVREELGRPAGLADPQVYVLDPCCGTGAFLVEVLNRIAKTLQENWGDALLATDLKKAATERVYGFELLPAPFVVSHLQIGLMLQNHGAPLSEKKKERVSVYLTNALTGWEPPKQPKKLPFVELEEERDAADHVKRDTPILVIIGNPPYNGFAGIANVEEERDLSLAYRTTKKALAPQGPGQHEHVDPKTGLSLCGPYTLVGQSSPTPSSAVGIVGPPSMIAGAEAWLQACKGMLTNDGSQPFLYPHFPGFHKEAPFQCDLVFGDTCGRRLASY